MNDGLVFVANSALLGVGLAMDAFSVSTANGLNDPGMGRGRMASIAGTFAGFQFLMPVVGWACVRTIAEAFEAFQRVIPWIALALLGWIGGKMLAEGLSRREEDVGEGARLGGGTLLAQGIATSIDALSVGFTISDYGAAQAFGAAAIIAAVTFVICIGGLRIGRRFGTRLAGKASVLGGAILIFIGLEIFVRSLWGV